MSDLANEDYGMPVDVEGGPEVSDTIEMDVFGNGGEQNDDVETLLVGDLAKMRSRLARFFNVSIKRYYSYLEPLVAEFFAKMRSKIGKENKNIGLASNRIEPKNTNEILLINDFERLATRFSEYLNVSKADYKNVYVSKILRFLRSLKNEYDHDGKGIDELRSAVSGDVNKILGDGFEKAA